MVLVDNLARLILKLYVLSSRTYRSVVSWSWILVVESGGRTASRLRLNPPRFSNFSNFNYLVNFGLFSSIGFDSVDWRYKEKTAHFGAVLTYACDYWIVAYWIYPPKLISHLALMACHRHKHLLGYYRTRSIIASGFGCLMGRVPLPLSRWTVLQFGVWNYRIGVSSRIRLNTSRLRRFGWSGRCRVGFCLIMALEVL